jgi:group I intron endonuclease
VTDKVYVGSSLNISKRWSRHRTDLRLSRHSNQHLQSSWNKYGERSFLFEILELTSDLTVREQYWIDVLDACVYGYNLCPVARSSRGRPYNAIAAARQSAGLRRAWAEHPESWQGRSMAKGESNHQAKLTTTQVLEIRRLYGPHKGSVKPQGGVTYASLAQQFNVHLVTIADIICNKTWKEVMPNGLPYASR